MSYFTHDNNRNDISTPLTPDFVQSMNGFHSVIQISTTMNLGPSEEDPGRTIQRWGLIKDESFIIRETDAQMERHVSIPSRFLTSTAQNSGISLETLAVSVSVILYI